MDREDIHRLLREAMRLTRHRDYVIIGSLSVLGAAATLLIQGEGRTNYLEADNS